MRQNNNLTSNIFAQNKIIQMRKKAAYTLYDIKGQKPINKEEGNYFIWSIITHAITQNLERKNRHSFKIDYYYYHFNK